MRALPWAEGVGVALDDHDVGPGARRDLGDSRAHEATSHHTNSFHESSSFRGPRGPCLDGKV